MESYVDCVYQHYKGKGAGRVCVVSILIVARSMLQRLKHVIQNNGGTLDIDILTVVKGNNVHKTGKLSLTSESQNYHLFVEKSVHKLLKHPV